MDLLAKIAAAPALYGLVAADATVMAQYVTGFTIALNLATDPATRTRVTTVEKNLAQGHILAIIRVLAKRVQANNTVTAAAKVAIGLPVHNLIPTPINPPATRPMLNVIGSTTAQLVLRIVDETTPTRPANAKGQSGPNSLTAAAPIAA